MKTFFVSISIFLLLISVIIMNSFYINRISEQLMSAAKKITAPNGDRSIALSDFSNLWHKNRNKISLSVNYVYIENIGERLAAVKAAHLRGDNDMFLHELAMLKEEIRELNRLERFSSINLF